MSVRRAVGPASRGGADRRGVVGLQRLCLVDRRLDSYPGGAVPLTKGA